MKKLWYFITLNNAFLNEFDKCKIKKQSKCIITVNGERIEYELATITNEYPTSLCIYNRETSSKVCGQTSSAVEGEYYIKSFLVTNEEAKDMTGSICTISYCVNRGDYWNASMRKCETQGARLANVAELKSLASQGKVSGYTYAFEENESFGANYVSSDGALNNHNYYMKSYGLRAICIGE